MPVNRLDLNGGVAIGVTYAGVNTAPTNGLLIEVNVGISTTNPTSKLQVTGLPIHADNTASIEAGLTAGAFYHNGDGIVRVVY